jgi:hypothetical protein
MTDDKLKIIGLNVAMVAAGCAVLYLILAPLLLG